MSKTKLCIVLLLIITFTASIIILPACKEEAAPVEEVAEEEVAPEGEVEEEAIEEVVEEVEEIEEFDYRQFAGSQITILGCAGPFNPEIQEAIEPFFELTGIEVALLDFVPETEYYNKVQLVCAAKQGEYDIYMVGFPNMIDWVPAGWLEPLDAYLEDPTLTSPDMDLADFYPKVIENCYWDGVNGHKFGSSDNASLYVLPLGCMINTIMYRKDIFDKYGLEPPKTVKDAIEVGEIIQENEPGMYGLAIRGNKEVATLYGGIWQTLKSYGAEDFNGDLKPLFNSPEMIKGLEEIAEMINKIGNINSWANMTWYEVMTDLASGQAAMALDAVPLVAWINAGEEAEAQGKLAYSPALYGGDREKMVSSLWSWNLGISSDSKSKEAAWLFVQYVTGKKMQAEGTVMAFPTRSSVFESPEFIAANEVNVGFFETWEETIPYSGFIFTPAVGLNDYGYYFVGEIQNVVLGVKTAQKAMDDVVKYYNDNF
ncbi:MAG: sugar ABC transporter substrate-binding protein [Actinobacteria bacterium]|nr:sugar ABC transporter substrate-binding protein [Actinomycetota bacterium]